MNYPIARQSRFERKHQERWDRKSRSRLERIAKSGAMSTGLAGALFLGLAGKTRASIINVCQVQDVIPAAPVSRTYRTYNLRVEGQEPQALVLVFAYRTLPDGRNAFIGGLENLPENPFCPLTTAIGFINKDDANFWGLENYGDVLGGNVPGGFFGFYDKNKDGKIGTYDTVARVLIPDEGEAYPLVSFSGFEPFPAEQKPAMIDSINLIPEPSTGGAVVAGLIGALIAKKARKYFS